MLIRKGEILKKMPEDQLLGALKGGAGPHANEDGVKLKWPGHFEVFPVLQLNNELQDLFGTVYVLKLSANEAQKYIRIHTSSNRLIHRQNIKQVETQIKNQLFSKDDIQIQLIEKYDLSNNIPPKSFFGNL